MLANGSPSTTYMTVSCKHRYNRLHSDMCKQTKFQCNANWYTCWEMADLHGSNNNSKFWITSVHVTICRLGILLIGNHFLFESNEDLFDCGFPVPLLEQRELAWLDSSILLVYWGDVNFGVEFDGGLNPRVVRAALNTEEVDTIIEVSVLGTNNSTVPAREWLVVAVIESIGNALVSELTLLTLLEFFVKSECTWH